MGFFRWTGTELERGKVFQWDGTELRPGVVKEWPWIYIEPPPPTVGDLDGGDPSTTTFGLLIDGGTPTTEFTSGGDLIAAMPTPVYVGHRFGKNEWCQDTLYAANNFFLKFTSPLQHLGECDLHVLSDGVTMVLSHDATVTYSGSSTAINTLTPAQWDTVVMDSGLAGVPNQPASFWTHPDYPAKSVADTWALRRIMVPEMKNAAVRVPLMDWIDANNAYGSIIVQWAVYNLASYTSTLKPLADAGIKALAVCYSLPGGGAVPSLATMATDNIYGIMISTTFLAANPTLLADAHAEGLKVFTFNSNTSTAYAAQIALGVDAPLSDNPSSSFPTSIPPDPTAVGDGYDGGTP